MLAVGETALIAACLPTHEDRPTSPVGRLIPPKSIGATSLLLSSHCIPLLSKAGSRWPPVEKRVIASPINETHPSRHQTRGWGNCPRPNIRDWDQIDSIRTVGSHRAVGDAWCGGGRQTGTVCQRCASKRERVRGQVTSTPAPNLRCAALPRSALGRKASEAGQPRENALQLLVRAGGGWRLLRPWIEPQLGINS